ncbi:MAG TPA: 3-hydroxyacyl-CoA dehydrogenase NAD-binding domain-containing protein [Sphingobium sp.]|nr:3-hydroxyacyl-CoA dehydrogenase NAD-binding domain-containing protein [Sphingobium sp.]
MEIRSASQIAVIGAGTMGVGIAQVAAASGHQVVVIDRVETALTRGRETLKAALDQLVKRGRLDPEQAEATIARIHWSPQLEAAADCALVIEAIVERLDVKQGLFAELEKIVSEDALLATNTSSLSVTEIATHLTRPARFLGLHFFNPVPAMKLVEVVAGVATSPRFVTSVTALMKSWSKHPVTVRDVPGFIVNRIARPYYAEAFLAWDEGVEPAAIDAALTGSGGFRMGPLTLADMIGHDINYAAAVSVHEGLQPRTRFRPQAAQARLVEQGHLGRKAGQGVYRYGADVPPPPLREASAGAVIRLPATAGTSADLIAALSAPVAPEMAPGIVSVDGLRVAMGDGRSLRTRLDVDMLIDHALDFRASSILVATVRDEAGAQAAAGLAGALGKQLLLLPDRPGQIVLRTYAQIANGAVDAVREGVASAEAVDEAMLYGANYPVGPMAWAIRNGPERIREALTNIASETGNPLYEPASDWQPL